MNTNSTTPRPCAGCSRDLGYVMRTLAITYDGWRYEVCGHTDGCANRLMARLSQGSTTTTSATNDTERDALVAEVARLRAEAKQADEEATALATSDLATTEQVIRTLRVENERLRAALEAVMDACDPECYGCGAYYVAKEARGLMEKKP